MHLDAKKITLVSLIVTAIAFLASCGDDKVIEIENDILAIGESSANEATSSEASTPSYEDAKVYVFGDVNLYISDDNIVRKEDGTVVGTYDPEKQTIIDNEGNPIAEDVEKNTLPDDKVKVDYPMSSESSEETDIPSSSNEAEGISSGDDGFIIPPPKTDIEEGYEAVKILDIGGTKLYITENNVVKMDENIVVGTYDPEKKAIFDNQGSVLVENVDKQELADDQLKKPGIEESSSSNSQPDAKSSDGSTSSSETSAESSTSTVTYEGPLTQTVTKGNEITPIVFSNVEADPGQNNGRTWGMHYLQFQFDGNAKTYTISGKIPDYPLEENNKTETLTINGQKFIIILIITDGAESSNSVSSSSEEQLSSNSDILSSSSESQTVVESSNSVVPSSSSMKPVVESSSSVSSSSEQQEPSSSSVTSSSSSAKSSSSSTVSSSSMAKVTVEGDLVQTVMKGASITPIVFRNVEANPGDKGDRTNTIYYLDFTFDPNKHTYTVSGSVPTYDVAANQQSETITFGSQKYTIELTITSPSSSSIASSSSSSESSSSTSSSSVSSSSTASSSSYSGGTTPNFKIKEGGRSGQGWGSRYWDCCMPHCAWSGNTGNPTRTCNSNMDVIGESGGSACNSGSGGVCDFQAPWAASENLAYAFAAVPSGLGGECGKCFLLTFDGGSHGNSARTGALKGKQMVIMVSNIGGDVGSNQFDIMIPGGGVGLFNGCGVQLGISSTGAQYGGFISDCSSNSDPVACVKEKCSIFSKYPKIQAGCEFSATWYNAADNPTFHFDELESCPNEISSKW